MLRLPERKKKNYIRRPQDAPTVLKRAPPGVLVLLRGEHLQLVGAQEREQRRVLLHVPSGQLRQEAPACDAEHRGRCRCRHDWWTCLRRHVQNKSIQIRFIASCFSNLFILSVKLLFSHAVLSFIMLFVVE